jgi:hypothetical protein
MVLVLGDTRTLDAVMRDPFLQKVDQPTVAHLNGAPSSRTVLDFLPERVLISPRGESVAVLVNTRDHEEASYFIGRAGGALTEVHADTARFVDERRILVADPAGSGTLLRLLDTDQPAVSIWETRLDLNQPSISTDRTGVQWRVLGLGTNGGVVKATGAVNGGAVRRREWRTNAVPENDPYWPLAAEDDRLLARATVYDSSMFAALGAWSYWLRPFNSETKFVVVGQSGVSDAFRTQLHVQCEPAADIDDSPVCSAHDGSRVHLSVLRTGDASVTPIAKFDRAMSFEVAPGWVTGWSNTPFALDLSNRRLVFIGDELRANRWPHMMAANHDSIGVVWNEQANGRQTILEIYSRNAIGDQRASVIRYR